MRFQGRVLGLLIAAMAVAPFGLGTAAADSESAASLEATPAAIVGATTGGTVVTLKGAGLSAGTITFTTSGGTTPINTACSAAHHVTLGCISGRPSNGKLVSFKTPAGAGTATIGLASGTISSSLIDARFFYGTPAIVTSISPNGGPAGTVLTIKGVNLSGVSSVTIGGVTAPLHGSAGRTAVHVTVPTGSGNTTTIAVGGATILTTANSNYAYSNVSSISAVSGATTGGTVVTLKGAGLSAGTITFTTSGGTTPINTACSAAHHVTLGCISGRPSNGKLVSFKTPAGAGTA